MFGYITINGTALSEEEKARYRTYYCGLCRALHKTYGTLSRLTLSNDMTFLGMTLSSLYEPAALESASICPVHPMRKQGYLKSAALDYAACGERNASLAHGLQIHVYEIDPPPSPPWREGSI